jgi:hypothetical protein
MAPEQHVEPVFPRIVVVRETHVMFDSDLAEIYGVATKVFNQAIKRNHSRFPDDFAFSLSTDEWDALRSQFVTLKPVGRGTHRKCRNAIPSGFAITQLHDDGRAAKLGFGRCFPL